LGKYSSKKLRTGLKHSTAADRTVADAKEGAAANGLSPVGPLEGHSPARHEATVNGSRQADGVFERDLEGLQGNKLELDSSMGNGPVSHKSMASVSLAAAREGASVSQKALGATHLSAKSFASSGREWCSLSSLSNMLGK